MFSIADRHVLGRWWRYFLLCLALTLGILLLENLYNHLHELLRQGISLTKIACYYFLFCPQLFPLVVPVAFFLSLLLALGELDRHGEIIAFQAAGIPRISLTRSLAAVGLLLSLLLSYFQDEPAVRARKLLGDYQAQMGVFSAALAGSILHHVGWNDEPQGRLWYMRSLEPSKGIATAVHLHERDAGGHEWRRISAAQATFDLSTRRWIFSQGRLTIFDLQSHYPQSSILFERYELEDLRCSPSLLALHHKKPGELTFHELRTLVRQERDGAGIFSESRRRAQYLFYWNRLLEPWACLLIFFITLPCATGGHRSDAMASFGRATGLLFAFYLLSHVCRALGLHGTLGAPLAALGPYLLLILCALPSYRSPS
ncbi:MAG: LptF/LptG family permease [Puniceicoccales bacterium]|jgi:lipopolysaccharide export LptBFGC system permease protein LptF|nr:LptF/LptG family permease [Puniceicoccales bacterium]